ncbi:MAG TPA: ABC transporter ATP-binding protein [Miltoncostaeales bacterium]|nr:ABC transporter ATP-binding protein [Miltoncostaeales bacterium]
MTPVLQMRDVRRDYGNGPAQVVALDGVSIEIAPGELVAVMGPSGSGKSTLLNLAGGLDEATSGQIVVAGVDLAGLDQRGLATLRRRQVGIVFQELNLLPTLTAVENVMLPLELDGSSSRAARAVAEQSLVEVGLDRKFDRYPDDLSGGQQQRVAIARALTGDRPLLLADEPTGALDTLTGEKIIELIADRTNRGNVSALVVTHEPRVASFADRVIWLRDGQVVDDVTATTAHAVRS